MRWRHVLRPKLLLLVVFAGTLSGCAVAREPDAIQIADALGLIDRGTALLRLGELEGARAAFEVAYELHPTAQALDGLGCVALRSEDMILAEEAFRRAIELEPEYPNARANLAYLYDVTGYKEQAGEMFRAALADQPNDVAVRNNFAVHLFERGESLGVVREELLRAGVVEPSPIVRNNGEFLESLEVKYE